jgi:OmcA/MtrC family decaheme c-type cytochrome
MLHLALDRRCLALLLSASSLALSACGSERGAAGSSCSVKSNADTGAATITCDDGTTATVDSGMGASTCTVKDNGDGSKTIKCSDGTSVMVADGASGKDGAKGAPGADGAKGANGANGTNGADGAKGADGANGADGINGTNAPDGGAGNNAHVVGGGLKIEILSVAIPSDRQPVVELKLLDAKDRPLDRTGVQTVGAVSANFVLSWLSSSGGKVGEYVPYNTASVAGVTVNSVAPVLSSATEPQFESIGTWTELDPTLGTYRYRFANAIASGYDATKTHTLAVFASRTFENAQYAANPIFHFRPDGATVTEKRAVVTTTACNQCHDPLQVHGGSRREVGLCITCHVDGMNDPESGNSLDMAQMIHKIHRGKSLPSVVGNRPYQIVGYMNAVHDYSTVVFPQAIENCDSCHQGGADSLRWKTAFSRTACGSCHDNISFENPPPTGLTLHSGGKQTTDTLCENCHGEGMGPIATLETDVTKVHRIAQNFDVRDTTSGAFVSAAPTLTGGILGVTGTGPTEYPVITFSVAVNNAPYDILATGQALDRVRFTFAGPTTDFVNFMQYTAQASSGVTGTLAAGTTAGQFTWTSAKTMTEISTAVTPNIPLSGSWAVGMEARLKRKASNAKNVLIDVNYPMHNDVFYFAVTGSTAVARRTAVVVGNCNKCHDDLQAHGGSRNDPEYCVLCHNANKDTTNIPAPATGTTKLTSSLRLSHMVHRIHTGEKGTSPFQVGTTDFSDVRFPGDRRDCAHCHVPDHYKLPLPPLLPSHMTMIDSTKARVSGTDKYMGATGAACTGCHDGDQTAVHVATQALVSGTDPSNIQEACATCHAAGQAYGIDIVHARPGL